MILYSKTLLKDSNGVYIGMNTNHSIYKVRYDYSTWNAVGIKAQKLV